MVRSCRAALFVELGIGNEFSVTDKVAATPSLKVEFVTALSENGIQERLEAAEVANFVGGDSGALAHHIKQVNSLLCHAVGIAGESFGL